MPSELQARSHMWRSCFPACPSLIRTRDPRLPSSTSVRFSSHGYCRLNEVIIACQQFVSITGVNTRGTIQALVASTLSAVRPDFHSYPAAQPARAVSLYGPAARSPAPFAPVVYRARSAPRDKRNRVSSAKRPFLEPEMDPFLSGLCDDHHQ